MELLKERKAASNSPWIFPNADGEPEGHFLRSLKRIARTAGLNCGKCDCKRNGQIVRNACSLPGGECHEHYLHRLRKSRATFWHEKCPNISIRTIQVWLGHKSLDTTQKYLGVQATEHVKNDLELPMYRVS